MASVTRSIFMKREPLTSTLALRSSACSTARSSPSSADRSCTSAGTPAFARTAEPASVPVQRARAFAYILEHKTIHIGAGELIVGERGPAPKATPTYPEVCIHSLQDLRYLNDRKKTVEKVFPCEKDPAAVYGEHGSPCLRFQIHTGVG